ncbi:MAG TPA: TetR family transcriptional regulator [Synergistales bacterium]|nr:TetR family transcriptional regulator [Synergistales bacterium]
MVRRVREEALETRKQLLEAALEIMSEKPFSSVSMTEIARKIGLSKGAIYWHFKNKNDVLLHVILNIRTQMAEEFCADSASLESIDDMRTYYKKKMQKPLQDEEFKKIHRLMHRGEEWPEEIRKKVLEMILECLDLEQKMTERLLVRAQEEGTIRMDVSPRDLSLMVTAMFQGIFVFQVHDFYHVDLTEHIDFIFDAFKKELDPANNTKQKG